jgi:hypothetical protein
VREKRTDLNAQYIAKECEGESNDWVCCFDKQKFERQRMMVVLANPDGFIHRHTKEGGRRMSMGTKATVSRRAVMV